IRDWSSEVCSSDLGDTTPTSPSDTTTTSPGDTTSTADTSSLDQQTAAAATELSGDLGVPLETVVDLLNEGVQLDTIEVLSTIATLTGGGDLKETLETVTDEALKATKSVTAVATAVTVPLVPDAPVVTSPVPTAAPAPVEPVATAPVAAPTTDAPAAADGAINPPPDAQAPASSGARERRALRVGVTNRKRWSARAWCSTSGPRGPGPAGRASTPTHSCGRCRAEPCTGFTSACSGVNTRGCSATRACRTTSARVGGNGTTSTTATAGGSATALASAHSKAPHAGRHGRCRR
ncbi:MAG: hypothetical protein ACO36H_04365, partial [Burkholderiaceae bacterium]